MPVSALGAASEESSMPFFVGYFARFPELYN